MSECINEIVEKFRKIEKINEFLEENRRYKNCFVVLPFILDGKSDIDYGNTLDKIYERVVKKDFSVIDFIEQETIGRLLLLKAGRVRFLKNFDEFKNLLDSAIESISFENYIGAIAVLSLIIEPLEKLTNKSIKNFKLKLNNELFNFIFCNKNIKENEKKLLLDDKLGKISYSSMKKNIKNLIQQVSKFCYKNECWLKYEEQLIRYFIFLKYISIFFLTSENLKNTFFAPNKKENQDFLKYFNRNTVAHNFKFFNEVKDKILQYKIVAGLVCIINYYIEKLYIIEGFYSKNGISILEDISELKPTKEIYEENEKYHNKYLSDFVSNNMFINIKKFTNTQ